MFGYVKPYTPDLRVRENEMYKALYCGLCRSMGKCAGVFSRLTLNYDFVFLAAVRTALQNEKMCPSFCRCAAHPLKKRPCISDNPAIFYSAAAASLLTAAKVRDDINDSKGFKKTAARIIYPVVRRFEKRAEKKAGLGILKEKTAQSLEKLAILEKENSPSIDSAADSFGEVLSDVFSWGLEGAAAKIAKEIGMSAGRYIYIADAADDMKKDKKNKSYNPLNISPVSPDALKSAVRLELYKMAGAVELMDYTGKPELEGIIKNTVYEGLPKAADRIFEKTEGKVNE